MRVLAIGLVAGFYGALFGVGGGTVIVPLLVLIGLGAKEATASSLAAIGITAVCAVGFYAFYGEVKPLDALLVGVPATVGVVFGTALQQRLHNRVLIALFAVLLAAVGVRLVL